MSGKRSRAGSKASRKGNSGGASGAPSTSPATSSNSATPNASTTSPTVAPTKRLKREPRRKGPKPKNSTEAAPKTEQQAVRPPSPPAMQPMDLIRHLALEPCSVMDATPTAKKGWQTALKLIASHSRGPEQLKALRHRAKAAVNNANKVLHFCTPLEFNRAAESSGGTMVQSRAEHIVNTYVGMVADRFYKDNDQPAAGTAAPASKRMEVLGEFFSPSVLGGLLNPVREHNVVDEWSPIEIAKFESGMCLFGKRFHVLQRLIKTKTCKDIVAFYYSWKSTPNYKLWKKRFVPVNM